MESRDLGQGTHFTKMGADSWAKNAPEFISPICLPKPKSFEFQLKKASFGGRSPCTKIYIVLYCIHTDVRLESINGH